MTGLSLRATERLPAEAWVAVPEDPAIATADHDGRAPLDTAPDAPAIVALVAFARELGRARTSELDARSD